MPEDRGVVGFAENLLTILEEGRFTATYKFAVLLGLMDLCLEHSSAHGSAPTSVTTVQLAGKVIQLYWRHSQEYDAGHGRVRLVQNSSGQAEIISLIHDFRFRNGLGPGALISEADPKGLKSLVRRVEWKLVQMPLPRLQVVGTGELPFIYRIEWDDTIKPREFGGPDFSNAIRFIGDAGNHLVRLAGLLRPIVQAHWINLVHQFNRAELPASRVSEFLFGMDRIATLRLLPKLRELQDNRCFYCDSSIPSKPEIDHFIPWARYPDNGIENLVVAHDRCNGSKKAFLASSDHVQRWAERIERIGGDLQEIAGQQSWERHPELTMGVARGIYLNLPPDAKLWKEGRTFAQPQRDILLKVLSI